MAKENIVSKNEDGSVILTFPRESLIREYATSAVLCMPRGQGYDRFRYLVDRKYFKDNEDGTVTVTVCTEEGGKLTTRRVGQELKLPTDKVESIYAHAKDEDFIPRIHELSVSNEFIKGNYPNMVRCAFPDESVYAGRYYVVPNAFKDEEKSNDEKTVFSVPEYTNFSVRDQDGNDMLIPVSELITAINCEGPAKKPKQLYVDLPREAFLHGYDDRKLFKMPETGSHAGCVYLLASDEATENPDGSVKVKMPDFGEVFLCNPVTGDTAMFPAREWKTAVAGRGAEDYMTKTQLRAKKGEGPQK